MDILDLGQSDVGIPNWDFVQLGDCEGRINLTVSASRWQAPSGPDLESGRLVYRPGPGRRVSGGLRCSQNSLTSGIVPRRRYSSTHANGSLVAL